MVSLVTGSSRRPVVYRPVAAAVGQRLLELAAGSDLELGEDLSQVVLDRARAEEQLGGDLRVGQA